MGRRLRALERTDAALDPSNALVWSRALELTDEILAPAEDVTAPFRQWFDDPVGWAQTVARERLWRFERRFLESVRDNPKTALRCCRKCGKTHTLGIACTWLPCTRRALVITMSSKEDALKSQLWPRIAEIKARATIPLPGKLGTLQWKIGPRHEVIGLAASDEGAVRGFHAGVTPPEDPDAWERENLERVEEGVITTLDQIEKLRLSGITDEDVWLLVVLDEVQTIDDRIIQAFQGSIQGPRVRLVLSGNPLMAPDANHELARAHKRGSGYRRFHVSAYKADDELDADEEYNGVPPYLGMNKQWVQERREAWGEDSPMFRSDVLGQFSSNALPNQFVTRAILRQACEGFFDEHGAYTLNEDGSTKWKFKGDTNSRHIGWDVAASESGDDNVATFWDSGMLMREEVWKADDATKSADRIIEWAEWFGGGKPIPGRNIHVDTSGIGKIAAQYMARVGVHVDKVDAGSAAVMDWPLLCAEMEFENTKAKLLWVFRRVLQKRWACVPERFERIWQQAQWYSWEMKARAGGSVVAVKESKEDLLRLHGRSPDNLESCYVAWSRSSSGGPVARVVRSSRKAG